MDLQDELRPVGPGRYAFTLMTPWGQAVPAEMLVASGRGWDRRSESRDGGWSAFAVGPAVVAIRLAEGLSRPHAADARPGSPVPGHPDPPPSAPRPGPRPAACSRGRGPGRPEVASLL